MWPDQHHHVMCHNSIILQALEHVTRLSLFCYLSQQYLGQTYMYKQVTSCVWCDHKSSLSCYLSEKHSMPYIVASDQLRWAWPDYHHYVIVLNRIMRQKQEQVTSWVCFDRIITITLSVIKIEASNWQKIVWPDHYCHAICHDGVVWQTKEQGTNLAWWPDNHYPIICFSSIMWPDQHNHGMCHNSIILQTIKVTNSGWFDHYYYYYVIYYILQQRQEQETIQKNMEY